MFVEPDFGEFQVPHLATIGIKFEPNDETDDRSYSSVTDGRIEFWPNARNCEIEVLLPTNAQRLAWDVCVNQGWCGGVVEGKPTMVEDLLPKSGRIGAREYARLVVKADGGPEGEPVPEEYLDVLSKRFEHHFGKSEIDVALLHQLPSRVFAES